MDHVVHINNGSEKAEPLVLHLLPGEEIKLDLKVVNHGAPSNISLKASNDIANAVRTDKPDHYLAGEDIIPILARMPDVNRLEGEILLTGVGGQSRVPIIFIKDSEDSYDNGSEKDEELTYTEEDDEETNPDGADPESESSNDSEESEDTSRIKFSRDKDLQRYRASRTRRSNTDYRESENRDTDNRDINHMDRNTDRDRGYRDPEYRDMDYSATEVRDSGSERQIENASDNASNYEIPDSAEGKEVAEIAEESSNELKTRLFELTGDKSALLAVPAAMLIALIALLILTFYSESIPEFTGALASAMLIVTLIIYGAATLLKA
ncbi:MAG: hypothetical protein WB392_11540 [Methanotrichaceae archaeon]